jgi:hypothetical protein
MIPKDLLRIVDLCAEELDRADTEWALGGAHAMAVHGYERATKDVDLFVADDARVRLLERLEAEGYAVREVFPPSHCSVSPPRSRDPDVRVDLLFPALGVESLALLAARRHRVSGRSLPVFPLEHVIAAKLQVDPEFERTRYEKDLQDLRALRERGLIDEHRVHTVLDDLGDRGAKGRLVKLMKAERRSSTAKRR